MREISFETVKKLWGECRTPTMLYIHSPFCEQQCSYCVYRGRRPEKEEVFHQYYYDYLPRQIERNLPILGSLPSVPEVYFGGGTANFRGQLFHLEPVIDLIRPFTQKAEEVTIELHMGYPVTRDQINWLKKQGFTTVILCVQNLLTKVLKRKHRLCLLSQDDYVSQLRDVIEWCHEEELFVGVDLMFFPADEEGISELHQSVSLLEDFTDPPDELSIATEYAERNPLEMLMVFEGLKESHPFLEKKMELEYPLQNSLQIRVVRWFAPNRKERMYGFIPFLDDEEQFACSSVLGIGSYQNSDKDTYSVINGVYTIAEKCSDLQKEPSYLLLREVSFWDRCRNTIDFLEKEVFQGINPPRNALLSFCNNPRHVPCRENTRDSTIQYEIRSENWELIPEVLSRLMKSSALFQEQPDLLRNIQCFPRRKI